MAYSSLSLSYFIILLSSYSCRLCVCVCVFREYIFAHQLIYIYFKRWKWILSIEKKIKVHLYSSCVVVVVVVVASMLMSIELVKNINKERMRRQNRIGKLETKNRAVRIQLEVFFNKQWVDDAYIGLVR